MEKPKYIDNEVFAFCVYLKDELELDDICVYVKPFKDIPIGTSDDERWKTYHKQEDLVQTKYFTKEKIDELKNELIKKIQECENPFNIYCNDRDGNYNITEDMIFNLD